MSASKGNHYSPQLGIGLEINNNNKALTRYNCMQMPESSNTPGSSNKHQANTLAWRSSCDPVDLQAASSSPSFSYSWSRASARLLATRVSEKATESSSELLGKFRWWVSCSFPQISFPFQVLHLPVTALTWTLQGGGRGEHLSQGAPRTKKQQLEMSKWCLSANDVTTKK